MGLPFATVTATSIGWAAVLFAAPATGQQGQQGQGQQGQPAAAPAPPPVPPTALAARVDAALAKARAPLLQHLGRTRGGMLALCCLAAAHDGVPTGEPAFAQALADLARTELDDTYGLSLRLMVMAELADFPDRAKLAANDTELLLQKQTSMGGFSYGGGDGWFDLSNTQYAALGLRAAVALGQDVPVQRWALLHQAVMRMQHEDGGFTYRPGQGAPSTYASMAAAGIAVMEICAQQLRLDPGAKKANDVIVQRTWDWLAARTKCLGDRRERFSFYFHYGLERAAILCGRDEVGGVDWYAAGAAMLCDEQLANGGWSNVGEHRPQWRRGAGGHPVDTSFAVLFLRKNFRRALPAVTGPGTSACAQLALDADDAAVRAAAATDAAAGDRHAATWLACLRGDAVARRKAAILALFAVAKDDFGLSPYRDAAAQSDAIARAEGWLASRPRPPGGPAR